ncbi:MAG: hypothetical protein MI919_09725 [Holophagales bacterium]|nr:hypothetical protein [Holophagales bacterium]
MMISQRNPQIRMPALVPQLVLVLLMVAPGWNAARSAEEPPDYRFRAVVHFPTRAFLSPPRPEVRVRLRLEARKDEYLAAPELRITFGGKKLKDRAGNPCPRRAVIVPLSGGESGAWSADRKLDCTVAGPAAPESRTARWRLLIKERGWLLTPEGVEITVPGVESRSSRSSSRS